MDHGKRWDTWRQALQDSLPPPPDHSISLGATQAADPPRLPSPPHWRHGPDELDPFHVFLLALLLCPTLVPDLARVHLAPLLRGATGAGGGMGQNAEGPGEGGRGAGLQRVMRDMTTQNRPVMLLRRQATTTETHSR